MTEDIGSTDTKQFKDKKDGRVNLGRHASQCTICLHANRWQIEQSWINWDFTHHIAQKYGVTRDAIYRHAHALDLFRKREANIKRVYEKIIERVDVTQMNGSNIISALNAYVKISNARQEAEHLDAEKSATPGEDQNEEKEHQIPETKRIQ